MKKTGIILLALLLAFPLTFASCAEAEPENKQTENTSAQDVAAAEEEVERTTADIVKENYSGYNYDGYEYRIVSFPPGGHFYGKINSEANEVWYEEMTGDSYTDAVYNRNILSEDLVGIKITPVWSSDVSGFVKKETTAGDDYGDAIINSLAYNINLGMDNYVYNFRKIDSMDLSAPWWDQNTISNYSYKNTLLYALCGDYMIFDDYALPVIFFNKKVIVDNALESPTDLVRSGDWTLEKMMDQAEAVTFDLNGDGKMDYKNDAFGYLDNGAAAIHLLAGIGSIATRIDEDGVPTIAIQDEYYISGAEMVYNLVICSNAIRQGSNAEDVTILKENRGLYYYELIGVLHELRDMEEDFSLLPQPKRNVEQEKYQTLVNPIWCTALAVPTTCSDYERSGIILDVMSGFSTDTVNHTLHELMLGAKLIRDEETVVMLDTILNSKVYDWAEGFDWYSSVSSLLNGMTPEKGFTFVSSTEKMIKSCNKVMSKMLDKLESQMQ